MKMRSRTTRFIKVFCEGQASQDEGKCIYSDAGVYLNRFLMRSKTFLETKLQLPVLRECYTLTQEGHNPLSLPLSKSSLQIPVTPTREGAVSLARSSFARQECQGAVVELR
jgi:hypothetical protein